MLVGRDILSEKWVKAEATGLFAEPASSEAENRQLVRGLPGGASGESRNWIPVRGPTCEASSEAENHFPVRGPTCEASSEAENR